MRDFASEDTDRGPEQHGAPHHRPSPHLDAYRRLAFREVEVRRWLIIFVLLAFGVALLIGQGYTAKDSLEQHLLRDIGVAVLVASIGAALYETYARRHFELTLMNSFLGAVISDWSHPDIWNVVKAQVIEKTAIRDGFRIGIELVPDKRLGPGQMLLKVYVEYVLHGLRTRRQSVRIQHFLDAHLQIPEHKLPCFKLVEIQGEPPIKLTPPHVTEDGRFTYLVDVPGKGDGGIEVISRREEIIYVPGSHCFTMNEITRDIELFVDEIPRNIRVFAAIRSANLELIELVHGTGGSFHNATLMLLPGQVIEFLFQYRDDIAA